MWNHPEEGERIKRLRRIIFATLTVPSMLLCLAFAALWVRSHSVSDDLVWVAGGGGPQWEGVCASDRVFALRIPSSIAVQPGCYHHTSTPRGEPFQGETFLLRLGFAIAFDRSGPKPRFVLDPSGNVVVDGSDPHIGDDRLSMLGFPLWFPTALFAILPAGWMIARVRLALRPIPGHCAKCGYDLRATPDRCPECGKVPCPSNPH